MEGAVEMTAFKTLAANKPASPRAPAGAFFGCESGALLFLGIHAKYTSIKTHALKLTPLVVKTASIHLKWKIKPQPTQD